MKIKELVVNKRRCLLLFSLLFFLAAFMPSSFAFAQTATEMDAMLTANTIRVARAARFVLGAADLLPAGVAGADAESSTEAEGRGSPLEKAAYDMASSNGWINVSSDEAVTMKDAAFLIMKAFDLKGGVMYSLFSNPRYAYREMVYRKLIPGSTDQGMKVSGAKLLLILDKVTRNEEIL